VSLKPSAPIKLVDQTTNEIKEQKEGSPKQVVQKEESEKSLNKE